MSRKKRGRWLLVFFACLIGFGCSNGVFAAASPVIFFTDLESGPNSGGENGNGVYVTLYGNNFGATQGSSTVTLNGASCLRIVSWGVSHLGYQKIIVQLQPSCTTGNLVVTVDGQASNTQPFTVRSGRILFITPNGTGTGTISSPASPTIVYNSSQVGDTYYLRAGNYTGDYGDVIWGNSNFTFGSGQRGTASNPIGLIGYPEESVTLTERGRSPIRMDDGSGSGAYITVANMTLLGGMACIEDGGIWTTPGSGALGIRIVGVICSANYTGNTMTGVVSISSNGWRLFGNEIKDTGTTPPINNNHAFYVTTAASDVEIGWNDFHNLRMGHVIQVHTDSVPGGPNCFTFNNIRIHDNVISAASVNDSRGINVGNACSGSYGSIYNNLLYNLGQDFSAIAIYNGSWKIYNNTLYNIHATSGMIWINMLQGNGSATVDAKNNIFYSDGNSPYMDVFGGSMSLFTLSNNLYFNYGNGPAQDTTAINANPLFVSAGTGNFHLNAGSPAINTGTSAVSSTVARDLDGNPRPIESAYDMGVYEYGTATPDTTPPTLPANFNLAANATSQSSITLSWNPATDDVGIDHYIVERCTGLSCTTFTQVGIPAASPFVDSGLAASTGYSYHVRAVDGAGNLSGWSNVVGAITQAPDTQAPSIPSNLSATATSFSQINLTWTASTDNVGVTGYKVERCSGSGCTTFAQVGTPSANSYSDTGLTASTVYRYQVNATDAAGNDSGYSIIASATTQATPPLSANLVVAYNFNENTGTVANDLSGNNRNGTLTNGVAWATGKNSSGVSFDGTNDYVNIGTQTLPDQFTVSAWVNNPSGNSYETIATFGQNRQIYLNYGTLSFWSGSDTSFGAVPTGAWNFVAVTYDGTNLKGYLNGTKLGNDIAVSLPSVSGPTYLGAWYTGSGRSDFLSGLLDDVRIYNKALTQAEITTDMNTPLTQPTSTVSCNTVTTSNFSQSAYNSYGAPFDAFQTGTNLLDAKCNSADAHTINLTAGVTGDTTRIIYTKGYYYDPVTAGWTQYSGTCNGALNGEWCQGSVSATITNPNISTASAANPTYLVGMTCSVQNGSWRCGCRDTTCANFYWQVQGAGQ